ncbi:zinc-binding alcohol dehydrogenase family protein [uncultured Sphaerochaeta sp.]|uniref:zinc-binding alcohol dehydrogenase family protein n=1 Tax=uncultured Sphaerochaeta sp. TaxID=886478 RepID=UPI002A0A1DC1|nr:zinc-binding alcohol dehydrogenase family protein [uncultured Sphaerochaeta sp.]
MKVLQVTKPHELLVADREIRALGVGEVLVDVKRVGVCGSDLLIYNGDNPFSVYPRVIGHEIAGVVAKVAPDVMDFSVGDRVCIDPVLNCGVCDACRRGHPNVCSNLQVMGVHTDGGFASQFIAPSKNLYKIPEHLSWEAAVLVEPFSIGSNICDRTRITRGDRVLIVGSGVIGNTVLMTARMLGAEVIMCDILDEKLETAKALGARDTINSSKSDIQEEVMRLTHGDGVTVVVDAASLPSLFLPLLECIAPGGRMGILGFSKKEAVVNQFEITRKEITIIGSRLNNRRFPDVIETFAKGLLHPELLLEGVYPFAEAESIIHNLAVSGMHNGKTVISFP